MPLFTTDMLLEDVFFSEVKQGEVTQKNMYW